jgi:phosphatidate cytidylyltransferase
MAPVALAAVWFGAPYFPLLVAVLAIGMGWEWARLSGGASQLVKSAVILTAFAAVAAAAWHAPLLAVVLALLGAIVVWAASIATKMPAPPWTAAGTAWIVLPCVAILWIDAAANGRLGILWLLAVVWASDVGAYAAGRALGGPRLAPVLSPNKTWAGAAGGLIGAGLVGLIAALLFAAPIVNVVATSLILSVAAQLGDLAESLAKRRFGVKDSGSLIPGHGGLLDRLDSLLTAAATLGLLHLVGAGTIVD